MINLNNVKLTKTCHPESVENRTKVRYFQAIQDLTENQVLCLIGKILKYALFNVQITNIMSKLTGYSE